MTMTAMAAASAAYAAETAAEAKNSNEYEAKRDAKYSKIMAEAAERRAK